VLVKGDAYRWNNWEITESNQKWTKYDSNTIHFPGESGQGRGAGVTYTVKYTCEDIVIFCFFLWRHWHWQ